MTTGDPRYHPATPAELAAAAAAIDAARGATWEAAGTLHDGIVTVEPWHGVPRPAGFGRILAGARHAAWWFGGHLLP